MNPSFAVGLSYGVIIGGLTAWALLNRYEAEEIIAAIEDWWLW